MIRKFSFTLSYNFAHLVCVQMYYSFSRIWWAAEAETYCINDLQGPPGEFTHLQFRVCQLLCVLYSLQTFGSMAGDSYLLFGTSQNTLINMARTKSVIRKCILKMAHAPL
jgi:hypothetical protein